MIQVSNEVRLQVGVSLPSGEWLGGSPQFNRLACLCLA